MTVRHENVTDYLREYAEDKINGIHLDYPRIIGSKAILDLEGSRRHKAEIILFCANHIIITASSETENIYKSIDFTIDKITRRMRECKTRLLKRRNPGKEESIRYRDDRNYRGDFLNNFPEEVNETEEPQPFFVHKESFSLRKLFKEETIIDLDLTERPFFAFKNARRYVTSIVWRKPDGDYGIVDIPSWSPFAHYLSSLQKWSLTPQFLYDFRLKPANASQYSPQSRGEYCAGLGNFELHPPGLYDPGDLQKPEHEFAIPIV